MANNRARSSLWGLTLLISQQLPSPKLTWNPIQLSFEGTVVFAYKALSGWVIIWGQNKPLILADYEELSLRRN